VTRLSGRRIELWVEARDGVAAVNPIMRRLLDDLAADGAMAAVRVPEHEVVDPGQRAAKPPPDLVLLKTATTLGLSLAIADEAHGVRFLNAARATLRAHDKAATVARLAAAGLPVPTTFLVEAGAGRTTPPSGIGGAWVSKPTRGVHGRGVSVHLGFPAALDGPAILDAGSSYVVDDGTRLVQQRVGGSRADVKVYVADGRCFAGSKPFSSSSYAEDSIEPFSLGPETTAMVLAVGEALELRCFGVDLRFEGDRPIVIDANPFPGYRGFPDAASALRSEIAHSLERTSR
jgi:ribosomal protein S6--L-glutamate ligase